MKRTFNTLLRGNRMYFENYQTPVGGMYSGKGVIQHCIVCNLCEIINVGGG